MTSASSFWAWKRIPHSSIESYLDQCLMERNTHLDQTKGNLQRTTDTLASESRVHEQSPPPL